jgi:4-amino-4-deoxy-L-arabinose transferase-like glycosyltransferase
MKYTSLLLIIILAASLRFIGLGSNPPSLTWDEAALGYNAYAIATDGKDEYGNFLPVQYFESFGDFKPPAYVYLTVLPVMLFGLTEFAVRFPSALFGTLTVVLTYFLTLRIFPKSERKHLYGLISCAVLALSPWHIMLSRAAFEANVATFFLVSGVFAFLAGVQERKWLLPFSAVAFVLSLYTFNSARVVAPLLAIFLGLSFFKIVWKRKIQAATAIVIGIFLVAPLVPFLLSNQASIRFQEVNIFSDPKLLEISTQQIANDDNAFWSKLLHNRRITYGIAYAEHYLDHFNPSFLFIKGDVNPKFSIQDVGQFYLWDLPFLLIGVLFLFRKREDNWWIVPIWLLVGIIPAGMARETPHALRIEATLPTFHILIGYGIVTVYMWIKQLKWKKIYKYSLLFTALIILLMNVFYFQYQYGKHYPRRFSMDWQYGYEESIAYVKENQDEYEKVYVSEVLGRAYIYYLFHLKTPPQEFRDTVEIRRDIFGLIDIEGYNKYVFSRAVESEPAEKNVLYINRADKVPEGVKVLKTFALLDGTPILAAYVY